MRLHSSRGNPFLTLQRFAMPTSLIQLRPLFSRKSLKKAKRIGKDADVSKKGAVGMYAALATSRGRRNQKISTLLAEIQPFRLVHRIVGLS
jgi:hypothetical protein